jgi:hypothetical protein
MPPLDSLHYVAAPGLEGDVCLFELGADASPIAVEGASGRSLMVAPGDTFLATPGYRESTRWVVGGIPDGGLVPGDSYWVLADAGIVGDLVGDSPREKAHLGQVKCLGTVLDANGQSLNIRQFATDVPARTSDYGAPLYLVLGTSAEVGKTTAGIAITRSLRQQGHATVITLKATGTASLRELLAYLDFGVAQAFDCIDFGLPSTYPSDRSDMHLMFERALDLCLSVPADAVLVECGGDVLGANVPTFLKCLSARRSSSKVILAAADALAALGGKLVLKDMSLSVDLITGLCTDTPTIRQRTEKLCGIPALNMAKRGAEDAPF